jgi:hypothetical protein
VAEWLKNTVVTSNYHQRRWCVGKYGYVNPVSEMIKLPEGELQSDMTR